MIDKSDKTQTEELYLEKIRSLVKDIRYGNITLIIQDGKSNTNRKNGKGFDSRTDWKDQRFCNNKI